MFTKGFLCSFEVQFSSVYYVEIFRVYNAVLANLKPPMLSTPIQYSATWPVLMNDNANNADTQRLVSHNQDD